MRSKEKKTTTKAPNFITVYLPKDKALRDLFWEKAHKGISISGQLLRIVAKDLHGLDLISDAEFAEVMEFKFHPTTKLSVGQTGSNYSLYIPQSLRWLMTRVDDNLGQRIQYTARSRYVWTLFLKEYAANPSNIRYLKNYENKNAA